MMGRAAGPWVAMKLYPAYTFLACLALILGDVIGLVVLPRAALMVCFSLVYW